MHVKKKRRIKLPTVSRRSVHCQLKIIHWNNKFKRKTEKDWLRHNSLGSVQAPMYAPNAQIFDKNSPAKYLYSFTVTDESILRY